MVSFIEQCLYSFKDFSISHSALRTIGHKWTKVYSVLHNVMLSNKSGHWSETGWEICLQEVPHDCFCVTFFPPFLVPLFHFCLCLDPQVFLTFSVPSNRNFSPLSHLMGEWVAGWVAGWGQPTTKGLNLTINSLEKESCLLLIQ